LLVNIVGGDGFMRKALLGSIVLVLVSAVSASLMLSGIVTGPAPQPPVEFDVNVQNTPLQVEVTNPSGMPIATHHLTAKYDDAEEGEDFYCGAPGAGYFVGIDDKTVIFTGGSATGHFVFSCENGVGAVPARGVVNVTTASGSREFALPLTSMYRVEHVTGISVRVLVYRPTLPGPATYALTIEATVFWYFEE
jgi:hypothetical protein